MNSNIFVAIATCLAKSNVSEAYVVAAQTLTGIGPADIGAVIAACGNEKNLAPVERLYHGYHTLPGPVASVMFAPGVTGVVMVGAVAVEFGVEKIGDEAFRVLFHKVDAGRLALNTQERLAALEKTVSELQILAKR